MDISRIINPPKTFYSIMCFKCKCISHSRIVCIKCNTSTCKECLNESSSNPKICLNCHNDKSGDLREEQLKSSFWGAFQYKCKNYEFGCNQILWYTEILEHEKKCDQSLYKLNLETPKRQISINKDEELFEKMNTSTSDTDKTNGIIGETNSCESLSKFPISSYKNTHFLFFIETHVEKYEVMHIKNLITNEKYMQLIPGPGNYNHSAEFYKNIIFCCGGVIVQWGSLFKPIAKCWAFDLLDEKANTSLVLSKARFGVSLVSTPNALFCLGGKGQCIEGEDESIERTCEYLRDVNQGWKQTCALSQLFCLSILFLCGPILFIY